MPNAAPIAPLLQPSGPASDAADHLILSVIPAGAFGRWDQTPKSAQSTRWKKHRPELLRLSQRATAALRPPPHPVASPPFARQRPDHGMQRNYPKESEGCRG